MIKQLGNTVFSFILLVFLQVVLFNHVQFSGLINPYFYAIFILLLPFETPKSILLISSFLIGLSVDAFSHTLGMHAAACTMMAALRPGILKRFSPRDGYEPNTLPRISFYGLFWFAKYTILLILVHHFTLFYCEMFRFSDFFITFLRALLSTLFTSTIIIISQYFIFRR